MFYYDPETDSLWISLSDKKSDESEEVAENIILDFSEDGHLVALDIQYASKTLDLEYLKKACVLKYLQPEPLKEKSAAD